jgi:hypothetical protein
MTAAVTVAASSSPSLSLLRCCGGSGIIVAS